MIHPVLVFNINIDQTCELLDSVKQHSSTVQCKEVEHPQMLTLIHSSAMTVVQSAIGQFHLAKPYSKGDKLFFCLLSVEVALAFQLFAISWRSNAVKEIWVCIFQALDCFMLGEPLVYVCTF